MAGRDKVPRWRWMAVAAIVAACMAAGCSTKPARKKKSGQAAAARQRAEVPLVAPGDDGAAATVDKEAPAVNETPAAATDAAPVDDGAGGDSGVAGRGANAPTPSEPAAKAEMPAKAEPAAKAEITSQADSSAPSEAGDAPASPGSLSDIGTAPTARPGDRPTDPLVDADTALLLDGGRVEVASPRGWTRSPRSQKWLVRYQPGPRKSFPSIVVTAEAAPEGLEAVTGENQADLVAALTARLAVDFPAGGTVKVIKRPAAVTLGDHAAVAWAVPGSAQVDGLTEQIERFAWGVVLGGRLYVVEARAPKGKLDDAAKDRARAVAATLFRPADAPAGNPDPDGQAVPADSGDGSGDR